MHRRGGCLRGFSSDRAGFRRESRAPEENLCLRASPARALGSKKLRKAGTKWKRLKREKNRKKSPSA